MREREEREREREREKERERQGGGRENLHVWLLVAKLSLRDARRAPWLFLIERSTVVIDKRDISKYDLLTLLNKWPTFHWLLERFKVIQIHTI